MWRKLYCSLFLFIWIEGLIYKNTSWAAHLKKTESLNRFPQCLQESPQLTLNFRSPAHLEVLFFSKFKLLPSCVYSWVRHYQKPSRSYPGLCFLLEVTRNIEAGKLHRVLGPSLLQWSVSLESTLNTSLTKASSITIREH